MVLDDTSGNLVIDHSENGTNATNQGATINQTGLAAELIFLMGLMILLKFQIIQINLTQTFVDLTALTLMLVMSVIDKLYMKKV